MPLLYPKLDGSGAQGVAYLSPPDGAGGEQDVVSLDRFPDGTRMVATEVTPDGLRSVDGRLFATQAAGEGEAAVHLYRWRA